MQIAWAGNQHLATATLEVTSAPLVGCSPRFLSSAWAAPPPKVLGCKNHRLLLPLAPQHLPFLLPLQHLEYHIQVAPCDNRTEVFGPNTPVWSQRQGNIDLPLPELWVLTPVARTRLARRLPHMAAPTLLSGTLTLRQCPHSYTAIHLPCRSPRVNFFLTYNSERLVLPKTSTIKIIPI